MNYLNRDEVYEEITCNIKLINQNIENIKIQIFSKSSYTYELITIMEKEVNKTFKSIKELKNPFLLFVIGPGKYGKSTIINSLLEDNILQTKDIPNTWKLDSLIHSNDRKIEIIYENDDIESFNYEKGNEILKNEETKFKDSKMTVKSEFDKYKNGKKLGIEQLKLYKKYIEDKHLYKSKILEVRHYINKEGILNDFIIVDTPGLNQSLLENTKKRMIDYYKRADGVIWVLDSQNIVSKSTNDLLNDLKENYVVDNKNNNIICVVNKIDIIKKQEKDFLKVKDKISQIYSNYFRDIVLISSKEAIKGYIKNDKNLIESSNIKTLKDSINVNFKRYSEDMQIKSKFKNLKIMSNKIEKEIDNYKRNLYSDIYKFDEAKRILDEEIDRIRNYLLNHINKFLSFDNLISNNIKIEMKNLEYIIISEITKVYNYLKNISIFDTDYSEYKLNLQVNISKMKEIVNLENLILEYKINNNKNVIDLNIINKQRNNERKVYIIKNNINTLKIRINDNTLKKILELEQIIINNINISFRRKYTDYELIKNHLIYINNIDSILKKWRDDNE